MSKVEEITAYAFTYTPFDKDFPIRSCEIVIYAKTRKEAELIALANNYKFFDQSCTVTVKEFGGGYRQVKNANTKPST